jgi:cysteine desulfurase
LSANLCAFSKGRSQLIFPNLSNGSKDGFYNMLNVLLPISEEKTAMILFNLDMKGIAVS